MPLSGSTLAEAYVRVHADMSSVGPELDRGLNAAVTRGSRSASGKLSGAVAAPVKAGFDQAARAADGAGRTVGGRMRRGLGTGLAGVGRDTVKAGTDAGAGIDRGVAGKMRDVAATTTRGGKTAGEGFTRAAGKSVKDKGGYLTRVMHSTAGDMVKPFLAAEIGMKAINIFQGFIADARESAKVGRDTENVIRSTGGAAHVTAAQVGDLATVISNKTGADDEAIQSGENMLLTFTNIRNEVGRGNDIFTQASAVTVDLAAKMNNGAVTTEGMKTASIQLGKALNDPVKGVTALTKVGVTFDAQQKAQIQTLVASGRSLDAQKIILRELNKEFGGTAAAAADPMQRLSVIFENLGEQIGTALMPAINSVANVLADDIVPAVSTVITWMGKIPGPVYAAAAAAGTLYGAFRVGRAVMDSKVFTDVGRAMQWMGLRTVEAAAAEGVQSGAAGRSVAANDAAAASTTRLGSAMGMLTKAAVGVGLYYGITQLVGWAGEAATAKIPTDQFAASLTDLGKEGDASFRHLFARAGWAGLSIDAQSSTEALDHFADAMQIAFGQGFLDKTTRMLSFGASASKAKSQIGELDAGLVELAKGNSGAAAASFAQLAGKLREVGYSQAEITAAFPKYTAAAAAAVTASAGVSAAAKTAAQAHAVAAGAQVQEAVTLGALLQAYPKYKDTVMAAVGAEAAEKGAAAELTSAQLVAAKAAVAHQMAVDGLTASLQANNNAVLASRNAETAYWAALQATKDALKQNGATLDVHTAKGRTNRGALDGLASSSLAYLATIDANVAHGVPFRRTLDQQWQKLYDAARRFGATKGEAKAYANQILAIPRAHSLAVSQPGMARAIQAAKDLKRSLDSLRSVSVAVHVNGDGNFVRTFTTATGGRVSTIYQAEGGPVPDVPGSERGRDSVPAMLTPDEHVWTTREVKGAGGHGNVRRLRSLAARGELPAFAAGGPVRGYAAGGAVNRWLRVQAIGSLPADLRGRLDAALGVVAAYIGKGTGLSGPSGPVPGGSGVARWGPMVHRALARLGLSQSLWDNWMRQIATESGGNPNAINLWDSNARAGHPSQGLLQTIPGTFNAYHVPGTSTNIRDGWANMLAAMNYAAHVYGSRMEAVIGHGHGYGSGTSSAAAGWARVGEFGPELVRFNGGEQVRSAAATRSASADEATVRLHPDDMAVLAGAVAAAAGRRPLVIDGGVVAGYVDRALGRSSLSGRR